MLLYQIRLLAPEVSVDASEQTMTRTAGCNVVSITRGALEDGDMHDKNDWGVIFDTETCSAHLRGVTHIEAGDVEVFVHHFHTSTKYRALTVSIRSTQSASVEGELVNSKWDSTALFVSSCVLVMATIKEAATGHPLLVTTEKLSR